MSEGVPYLESNPTAKRYILFGYQHKATYGGWTDLKGVFDTKELAIAWATNHLSTGWWQVVDFKKLSVVASDDGRLI